MPESMIERVARAIYASHPAEYEPDQFEAQSPRTQRAYRKQARAAIAAMREPTPAMIDGVSRMLSKPISTDPKLLALLKAAKNHVMTPAERYAQRRSWVIGEMGIEHPEMQREGIERMVDEALDRMGYAKPT